MGQPFGYGISGAGQIVTDAECNPTDTYWEITPLNGQAGVTPNQGVGTSFNATFPAPGEYQISAIDIHPNCPNGDDEMIVCVYPTLQAVGQVAPLSGCAPLTVDLQDSQQQSRHLRRPQHHLDHLGRTLQLRVRRAQ